MDYKETARLMEEPGIYMSFVFELAAGRLWAINVAT